MFWSLFQQALHPVYDGFGTPNRSKPKLNRSQETRERPWGDEAEGEGRGSPKEDFRDGDGPNSPVLLLRRDKPTRKKTIARGVTQASVGNVLKKGSERKKEMRVLSKR